MAISEVEENAITVEEPLLGNPSSTKGGIRTLPFIIGKKKIYPKTQNFSFLFPVLFAFVAMEIQLHIIL